MLLFQTLAMAELIFKGMQSKLFMTTRTAARGKYGTV
jgi:hypothetical protein